MRVSQGPMCQPHPKIFCSTLIQTPMKTVSVFSYFHPPPLSMTPFLSCSHVLHQKPGLIVDTPPLVDDAFALSNDKGGTSYCYLEGFSNESLNAIKTERRNTQIRITKYLRLCLDPKLVVSNICFFWLAFLKLESAE